MNVRGSRFFLLGLAITALSACSAPGGAISPGLTPQSHTVAPASVRTDGIANAVVWGVSVEDSTQAAGGTNQEFCSTPGGPPCPFVQKKTVSDTGITSSFSGGGCPVG